MSRACNKIKNDRNYMINSYHNKVHVESVCKHMKALRKKNVITERHMLHLNRHPNIRFFLRKIDINMYKIPAERLDIKEKYMRFGIKFLQSIKKNDYSVCKHSSRMLDMSVPNFVRWCIARLRFRLDVEYTMWTDRNDLLLNHEIFTNHYLIGESIRDSSMINSDKKQFFTEKFNDYIQSLLPEEEMKIYFLPDTSVFDNWEN